MKNQKFGRACIRRLGSAFALIGLVIWSGCEDPRLRTVPNCYPGEKRACDEKNVCGQPGEETCQSDETWGACEGAGFPAEEVCDGLDNDCDGVVDNNIAEDGMNPCPGAKGACAKGTMVCLSGKYQCSIRPRGEVCNDEDDDCDGEVDNNVPSSICYSGPPGTAWVGECREGISRCMDGKPQCVGEVTPQIPYCVNGKDNDCNGIPDTPSGQLNKIDIVLFVDMSTSMNDKVLRVISGVKDFIYNYMDNDELRFAIVKVPGGQDGSCEVGLNLSNSRDTYAYLRQWQVSTEMTHDSYGQEPSYDCLYQAAGTPNSLNLHYRTDARTLFVLFTDEAAQTYQTPELTQAMVSDRLLAKGVEFDAFVLPEFRDGFQDIARETGGKIISLRQTLDEIADDLIRLLGQATCEGQ